MAGTRAGGLKAARTNRLYYGADFYKKIGTKGGKIGRTGGFAAGEAGRKRARIAGRKGGLISKRRPTSGTRFRSHRRTSVGALHEPV